MNSSPVTLWEVVNRVTCRILIVLNIALGIFYISEYSSCIRGERTLPTVIRCSNRLKQIGIALHAYHDSYGAFPPVAVRDAAGQPLHSWRVSLLPFIGEETLYRQFDLSTAWDSPHNLPLVSQMPDTYRRPRCAGRYVGRTPFVAIVGIAVAWHGHGCATKADFLDGLDNTIAVVELCNEPVVWTEPHDVRLPLATVGGREKMNVLFADGSVYGLRGDQPNEVLRSLFTLSSQDDGDRNLLSAPVDHSDGRGM